MQNVIYVESQQPPSAASVSVSHTLLSTNLGPYRIQLKVQRAVCHAAHCSRQKVWRHFMNSGHNKQPGEHKWIKYKWPLFFVTELGLPPKLQPFSTPPAGATVLICHLCHQTPRGCLDLMNGARASVPSLPSINFCGCAALKTNNSCWEASATLTLWVVTPRLARRNS